MERTDYPAIAGSVSPTTCIGILRDRVKRAQNLNSEISEWVLERRRIEDMYIQGLQRLARKPGPGDMTDLGIFNSAWQKVVGGAAALAASHQHLSDKLENEVERPLHDFMTSNKEWATFKTMEGNLAGIAKSIELAEEKAEKLKKKGKRAEPNRVAEAAQGVQTTMADWDSQAPFVLEKLQAIDELRLTHLRECLIRMQTLEIDQANQVIQVTEATVQALLDINTMDEIKAFTATKIGSRGSRVRGRPSTGLSNISTTDDSVSFQSTGSGEKGHSSIGGNLKRLGTVLRGRSNRNSTILPYQTVATTEPNRSNDRLGSSRLPATHSLSPQSSSHNLAADTTVPITPIEPPDTVQGSNRTMSSASDAPDSKNIIPDARDLPPFIESNNINSHPKDKPSQILKDADGYSIPPSAQPEHHDPWNSEATSESNESNAPQFKVEIRNDVIPEEENEADAAMSKVASTLRASQTVSKRNRGRRDIRSTIYGNPDTALNDIGLQGSDDMMSTTNDTNISFGENVSTTSTTNIAGHIMASSSENMQPTVPFAGEVQTPVQARNIPSSAYMPEAASDAHSIRSAQSTVSQGALVLKHPELHEQGLSASIIESVNAVLESGITTKASVIGEMALAHHAKDRSPSADANPFETIRLINPQLLEKIAPNPNLVSLSQNSPWEYRVSTNQLNKTTVAFKYQLSVKEEDLSTYVPIIVHPVWKLEEHQASLILNYKANPSYALLHQDNENIVVRNVLIIIGLEGAQAISCQSKPPGTFSKEKSRIMWKLPEFTMNNDSTGRFIARFATDGIATGSAAEIKWEITKELVDPTVKDNSSYGLGVEVAVAGDISTNHTRDPFADDEEALSDSNTHWRRVATTRKVVSGRYFAR